MLDLSACFFCLSSTDLLAKLSLFLEKFDCSFSKRTSDINAQNLKSILNFTRDQGKQLQNIEGINVSPTNYIDLKSTFYKC